MKKAINQHTVRQLLSAAEQANQPATGQLGYSHAVSTPRGLGYLH
jgi:hypothetical protein